MVDLKSKMFNSQELKKTEIYVGSPKLFVVRVLPLEHTMYGGRIGAYVSCVLSGGMMSALGMEMSMNKDIINHFLLYLFVQSFQQHSSITASIFRNWK
jgi:hypothetical protein